MIQRTLTSLKGNPRILQSLESFFKKPVRYTVSSCMCVFMYVYACMCMYICVCACVHACMCVCVCDTVCETHVQDVAFTAPCVPVAGDHNASGRGIL